MSEARIREEFGAEVIDGPFPVPEVEPALARELRAAWAGETHSFHMPAHKGGRGAPPLARELLGTAAFVADLSELGGFDYLHAPTGGLLEAQRRAADLFHADRSWFLVNGATVGNLAAVCAVVPDGEKVLLARGSHRSVYAGLVLAGAVPVYLPPLRNPRLDGLFGVDPDDARRALREHPDICAIHITSPNYYGFCAPVAELAEIAHDHGIPLIVDEAHGTHFSFHPDFPTSALSLGADLVVHSPHKTLGSLTQSSLLHLRGGRVDAGRLAAALQMFQSSSPSALLLVSLDLACAAMADSGYERWTVALDLAAEGRRRLNKIDRIEVYGAELVGEPGIVDSDPIKLVVDVGDLGLSGFAAAAWLRTHRSLNPEFADLRRLVCSITVADDETMVDALVDGFSALAESIEAGPPAAAIASQWPEGVPDMVLSPREASQDAGRPVALARSVGLVATEMVMPYPPGIPLLVPGERVTEAVLTALAQLRRAGCRLVGMSDPTNETLRCIQPPA
ncbi:MAG: aminotransferase class I/II-fold pyridoxal phosphate-dependent enzyme [Acidimicrobiales bacterium]